MSEGVVRNDIIVESDGYFLNGRIAEWSKAPLSKRGILLKAGSQVRILLLPFFGELRTSVLGLTKDEFMRDVLH